MTENQEIIQLWTILTEAVTINVFIKAIIIYIIIVWISIIVWVIRDITNRTDSIILQFLAILIILILGPFGIFIYLLFRPTRTLFEKYYEEVEYNIDHLGDSIIKKIENRMKNKEKNIDEIKHIDEIVSKKDKKNKKKKK